MGVQGGPWGFLFIGRRSNIGVRARAGNHGEIPGRELRCAGETELPSGAHGSAGEERTARAETMARGAQLAEGVGARESGRWQVGLRVGR